MKQHILIVEPFDVLRIGLQTIFTEDPRVAQVDVTTGEKNLQTDLCTSRLDLVIINKDLITEITFLPEGRFAILADELDMLLLQAAYKHGGRGYLSLTAPSNLLRMLLLPTMGSFLLDPVWTPWLIQYQTRLLQEQTRDYLFTPREREIARLLESGLDRRSVAKRLHIAEGTLKTHLKHIARKRHQEQSSENTYPDTISCIASQKPSKFG